MRRVVPFNKLWQKVLYRALCSLLLGVLMVSICGDAITHANSGDTASPSWANPSATALKKVGSTDTVQHQPNFLSNLDCTSLTYRMVGSSAMQTGCFTPTAFGMLDSDSGNVIFNGTDEAVPVLSSSPNQVLAPWPNALNLLTLDAADTGGSYLGMYKNPLASLQNQRNLAGQLISKKMSAPPEVSFKNQSGQLLVINPQTMAFSDGGSWLVAETLGGSFVRINLASLNMTAFAQSFGSQGSPGALLKSQVAVSSDGRYVAIENTAAASLKVYDLTTCGSNVTSWQVSGCQAHEYWSFASQQIGGLQSIKHIRFINDGLLSLEATSSNSVNSGVYELAPASSITSLTDYIGLGDSYTSGEGAFDYLNGTDTGSNFCHVSAHSYPLLLTRDLFSAAGGHSVACSGAIINDVSANSDSYKGQVSGGTSLSDLGQNQSAFLNTIYANYTPGYIAQHWFVKQYQPEVVTVSIGGNDIGFGDMLQNCVEPHVSRHLSDSTCYDTYESRLEMTQLIDRTMPRWVALYRQIRAESPGARVYAIGYPSIASDTGKCGLNVNLGKGELEFAEELIVYLNIAIQQSANTAGVPYIDISQALAGHRLCEASGNDVAVNGLTAGNDSGAFGVKVLGKESYHPNALGQELIEQAILRQSHNLTAGTGSNIAVNDSGQILLGAPKSGRTINRLVPDDTLTSPVLRPTISSPVQADGVRDGLQPNTTYTVRLDGSSGTSLATLQSDASGNILGQVTIPAGSTPGGHTIDITGTNQAGGPIDVTEPVYVAAVDNDTDGDGVPDNTDSCPTAINSGVDGDSDGIDDVCDSFVIASSASDGRGDNQPAVVAPEAPAATSSSPRLQPTGIAQDSVGLPETNDMSGVITVPDTDMSELAQTIDDVAVLSPTSTKIAAVLPIGKTARASVVLSAQVTKLPYKEDVLLDHERTATLPGLRVPYAVNRFGLLLLILAVPSSIVVWLLLGKRRREILR